MTDAVEARPKASARLRSNSFLSRFFRSKIATVGAFMLALIVFAACAAPWIAPQNPFDLAALDILDSRLPPGSASSEGMVCLLGTDPQGRDMLSAILYGLRISLSVGLASTLIALAVGGAVGLLAGYRKGWIDSIVMRIVDMQLSFPSILVALILISVLGQGWGKVVAALVTVQWAYYARTVRSTALVEEQKDYIKAARGLALSTPRIIFKYLLPNCLPPLLVIASVQIAHAIALEATLSFLGIGLPITEPSLGLLVANGYEYMLSGNYWISFFPGVALLLTIVAINLVGDRLRELLNPRFAI